MWTHKYLTRIDFKIVLIVFTLMLISLCIISSMTFDPENELIVTSTVIRQIKNFIIGWVLFLFFAGFDYQKLREWTWILYMISLVLLIGLYLVNPIQNVQRWFRVPVIGMNFQPSELTKLAVLLTLAWYLEKKAEVAHLFSTAAGVLTIVGIPFLLILKQPDLGTAIVLVPIFLSMGYLGGMNRFILKSIVSFSLVCFVFISTIFLGILPHQEMKPVMLRFLKPYQYERLNPDTYHQKASQSAICLGKTFGVGWHNSEFSKRKYLPASHTDSVFAAYCEEFGLVGAGVLMTLFFGLIFCCMQTAFSCKDRFGRYLASGIAIYLAMHILVNIAMMCGFLPITGVPLVLLTYGGSSILTTMVALGIVQSIYSRRFMF